MATRRVGIAMTLLLFAGLVLAIWRLTRLFVVDEWPPVRIVRDWVTSTFARTDVTGDLAPIWAPRAWRPGGQRETSSKWLRFWGVAFWSVAYIWTCPWCMSIYVGFGVWAVADWGTALSVPYPWLILAAGSLAAGIAGAAEAAHEQRYQIRQHEIDQIERGER